MELKVRKYEFIQELAELMRKYDAKIGYDIDEACFYLEVGEELPVKIRGYCREYSEIAEYFDSKLLDDEEC